MFKQFKIEVKTNSTKELKLLDLTVVVSTMVDMTDLVNNVLTRLPSSWKNVVLSLNTAYLVL